MSYKHILMIGKGGVGKSSLANAILGSQVCPVAEQPGDTVKCYSIADTSIGVRYIYDTRGLLDGEEEIKDIIAAISQVNPERTFDLVIACIKFNDRFDISNRMVFDVISQLKYGKICVALTNSDIMPADWPRHERNKRFKSVLEQWKQAIMAYLNEKHGGFLGPIPVLPTSHVQIKPSGPLRYWLEDIRLLLGFPVHRDPLRFIREHWKWISIAIIIFLVFLYYVMSPTHTHDHTHTTGTYATLVPSRQNSTTPSTDT